MAAGSNPVIPTLIMTLMINKPKRFCKVHRFSLRGGYIEETIPEHLYEILLSESEKAKNDNLLATDTLVGHLEESYDLTQMPSHKFQKLEKYLIGLCSEYEDEFKLMRKYPIISDKIILDKNRPIKLSLDRMWVNYQKKYEFNPVHDHTGLYSFVIWLKIPYSCALDEYKTKGGNSNPLDKFPGTFHFLATSDFRATASEKIVLDSTYEKTILIFPSDLQHCVYPFYTSDEYRISVSGNLYLNF